MRVALQSSTVTGLALANAITKLKFYSAADFKMNFCLALDQHFHSALRQEDGDASARSSD